MPYDKYFTGGTRPFKIFDFNMGQKNFYSTLACTDLNDEKFFKWFVGFSDGESNFTIVFQKDKNGIITGASFRFIIELMT